MAKGPFGGLPESVIEKREKERFEKAVAESGGSSDSVNKEREERFDKSVAEFAQSVDYKSHTMQEDEYLVRHRSQRREHTSVQESDTPKITLEALLDPENNRDLIPQEEGQLHPEYGLPIYSREFLHTYRGKMTKLPTQGANGTAFRFHPDNADFEMLGKYVHDIHAAVTITNALSTLQMIDSENPDSGFAFPLGAVIEKRTDAMMGDEEKLFTFTEFISDTSLHSYRAEAGKIQGEEWIDIMQQLSRSVGILHSYDIAHRDLHPQNVLMKGDRTVIVDPDDLTQRPHATNGSRVFTDGYLVLDFLGANDAKRQDICQLGMIGFELYTGISPLQYAQDAIGEHAVFLQKDQALEAIAKNVDDARIAQILEHCVNYEDGFIEIQHLRDALAGKNLPARVDQPKNKSYPRELVVTFGTAIVGAAGGAYVAGLAGMLVGGSLGIMASVMYLNVEEKLFQKRLKSAEEPKQLPAPRWRKYRVDSLLDLLEQIDAKWLTFEIQGTLKEVIGRDGDFEPLYRPLMHDDDAEHEKGIYNELEFLRQHRLKMKTGMFAWKEVQYEVVNRHGPATITVKDCDQVIEIIKLPQHRRHFHSAPFKIERPHFLDYEKGSYDGSQ